MWGTVPDVVERSVFRSAKGGPIAAFSTPGEKTDDFLLESDLPSNPVVVYPGR